MRWLSDIVIETLLTLLRVFPYRCETGLIRIGHPGRDAPVLLTGNYCLTVKRVRRALEGLDVWLLVANSRGVNVWCAAAGGHLTNHDVISALKTSGIESKVDHRDLILPQLAATGIEGRVIQQRAGWKVTWGPVEATDVPRFLAAGRHKTLEMRTVTFAWHRRLEMAVAWAFPISLLAFAVMPIWEQSVLPLMGVIWSTSLMLFLAFPIYERKLRPRKGVGFVFFNFGPKGILLAFWGLFILVLLAFGYVSENLTSDFVLKWSLASGVVILILGLDLTGSTPMYKSGLREDRWLRVVLDESRCEGVGDCQRVCPVNVFEVDAQKRPATMPGEERCVQCGACIVQCPCDALHFQSPSGDIVLPAVVRRFKLNLLGKRAVRDGGE